MPCDIVALRSIIQKLPSGPLRKQLRWAEDTLALQVTFSVSDGLSSPRVQRARETLSRLLLDVRAVLPEDADVQILEDSLSDA